ncbi:iqgap- protein [Dispira simplex]|nr:iqgap- protein [Dispira simplex]
MLQAVDSMSIMTGSPSRSRADLSHAPASPDVTGLRGRHRLQRHVSQEHSPRYLRNGNWCDLERKKLQAYEYLCHIGEAKEWIEACIQEQVPPAERLEQGLRDGVILAKLARTFDPEAVPRIFQAEKLQFRHSDNINAFLTAIRKLELPKLFHFEVVDLYERKNIPKVIYCIHALSHFLARQDLAPHIKNLLGYLQFTDEQLAITQQELANAGCRMPSFQHVSKALHGEAQLDHTELSLEGQAKLHWEKKIDIVIQFQAFARRQLAKREAVARRQAQGYTRLVQRVTAMQSLIRGHLGRRQLYETCLYNHYSQYLPQVIKTQALCRGALTRRHQQQRQLERVRAHEQRCQYEAQVVKAQAIVRGFLARKHFSQKRRQVVLTNHHASKLQALTRGYLARQHYQQAKVDQQVIPKIVKIQARIRGILERRRYEEMRRRFHRFLEGLVSAQAFIRGGLARREYTTRSQQREKDLPRIVRCQAIVRGFLTRRAYAGLLTEQRDYTNRIRRLQALVRGFLERQRNPFLKLKPHNRSLARLTKAQAVVRGWLTRRRYGKLIRSHRKRVVATTKIQAVVRGYLVRQKRSLRREHFEQHLPKIVQIQSMYRAKLAGRAYRTLTMEKNPPVSTMRSFVYLLDDSDQDFEEELELERLRQQAVRRIRDNHQTENVVNDLDIKIALLVKNRITLEELIKTSRYKFIEDHRYWLATGGGAGGGLSMMSSSTMGASSHTALGPFINGSATGTWNSLYHLDKDSRRRLESYQHLFYLLQTQPVYLARLLFALNKGPLGESNKKFMETIVLSLFGFAQNAREEYLLLKLFKTAIEQEIDSITGIHEFLRGNPVFIKLAVHHNRGAKERKFLRELLQPLVLQVIEDPTLDLESDPLVIYRGLIREEESRTGMRSLRPYDITREQALDDMETRTTLIKHLQQLRTITDQFIEAILNSLDQMPYGIRYIARELRRALVHKFPHERENTVMKVVGHLVYYRYINPAIVAPDSFDVVESVINPLQRKNLAEIAKMLNQVSVGKLFSDDNVFLQPLNNYVAYTSERFAQYSYAVTNVMDPEVYFQIDEFSDLTQTRKPVIYMSPQEVFTIHQALEDNLDVLAQTADDPLRLILHDVGPAPTVRSELKSPGHGNEISLTLTDRFADSNIKDHESVIKHLFVETKRYILYIIRVQSGKSLLDILEQPVTEHEERRFREIIKREDIRKTQQRQHEPSSILGPQSTIIIPGNSQLGGKDGRSMDKSFTPGGHITRRDSVSSPSGGTSPTAASFSGISGVSNNSSQSMTNKSFGVDGGTSASGSGSNGGTNVGGGRSLSASRSLLDLSALSFNSLKKMTMIHMAKLESENKVSKEDKYQAMLNSIATDIRNKHRRRVQRTQELRKIRQTLVNLTEKTGYLNEQKKTYLDYIHSCIQQLSHNKDRKNRTVLPFTRQYFHLRDLQRAGKVPQFGSYKYTAEKLHQKGVIVAIDGYNPRQFDKITLVISSDQPGVFAIEVSLLGIKMPGGEMEIRLEDLLQYQFNNTPVISIFDGAVRVNVNLLVFLINKKFYR